MVKKRKKLTKKKMNEFKKILEKEKVRLIDELKEIEDGVLKVSQAESSGENVYRDSYADSGTDTFERERDLSLCRNVHDILDRVNISLQRIEKSIYGVCSHCGDDISMDRLEALPYADLCIECKKKEENTR